MGWSFGGTHFCSAGLVWKCCAKSWLEVIVLQEPVSSDVVDIVGGIESEALNGWNVVQYFMGWSEGERQGQIGDSVASSETGVFGASRWERRIRAFEHPLRPMTSAEGREGREGPLRALGA